ETIPVFIEHMRSEKQLSTKDFIAGFAADMYPSKKDKQERENVEVVLDELESSYTLRHVDAKIVHTIYQNRERKNIIVCAGGYHINYIGPILEKMGYKHIKVIGLETTDQET